VSNIPVSQLTFVYPVEHLQEYSFTPSVHIPPLLHG